MVFNSFTFAIFFAAVLFLHYLPFSWRIKKFNLLWASYLFYAAWNPPFVALLWISTLVDWYLAARIHVSRSPFFRRAGVVASLCVNLGLLGYFKYGEFLLENLAEIARSMGIDWQPLAPDIVLPVGISFYTFQTLSYTLDVYRKKIAPSNSFLDYALYVTFFPQLVAGPIVRAAEFLPQCFEQARPTMRQLGWGLSLLTLGLFEKTVCADGLLAPIVEKVYTAALPPDSLSAWGGTLAFAGQIFCDFAGYSTCAIGVAMCLGFQIPDNFHFPYGAIGFSDFWRRWHMSLSTWLRDYLYIPLGGNRAGPLRSNANLMVTMLLGGLWHGASWTFIVWGAIHGCLLVLERYVKGRCGPLASGPHAWRDLALSLATFVAICFTWVFFRATSFSQALHHCRAMIGSPAVKAVSFLGTRDALIGYSMAGVIFAIHWLMRNTTVEHVAAGIPYWCRSLVLAAMIYAIVMMPGDDRAFIYFQF